MSPHILSLVSQPTRRPTRNPTRRPIENRLLGCVDDTQPSIERPSESNYQGAQLGYDFRLQYNDAQCTDDDDELYEYGVFYDVPQFSICAERCVMDVPGGMLTDSFRGFDWDCVEEACRCLYDTGTLDSWSRLIFDDTRVDLNGEGPVMGGFDRDGWFCANYTIAEEYGEAVAIA